MPMGNTDVLWEILMHSGSMLIHSGRMLMPMGDIDMLWKLLMHSGETLMHFLGNTICIVGNMMFTGTY